MYSVYFTSYKRLGESEITRMVNIVFVYTLRDQKQNTASYKKIKPSSLVHFFFQKKFKDHLESLIKFEILESGSLDQKCT
jgi:hypothetical protein